MPLRLCIVAVREHAVQAFPLGGQLRAQILQRLPGRPARRQPLAVAGEMIQHGQLETGVREQQALVLRMDIHQPPGHFLQDADRHRAVVDEAARAPGARHHPPDQQAAVLRRLDVRFRQQGGQRFVPAGELRLDHAGISPLGDHRRVRASAGKQRQGTEQDGLAGACLSCNNDKTLRKHDIQRVD